MKQNTDQARHIPDAILFAPLRIETSQSDQGGPFYVMTRLDNAPGTRNNFAVAECQSEADARFFSAAPGLLTALQNLLETVERIGAPGVQIGTLCEESDWACDVKAAHAAIELATKN